MACRNIELPYGRKVVRVSVPDAQLIGVFSPKEIPPAEDIGAEIRRALANPIGSAPLQKLVRGKKNVVFVADDNTRLTPTDQILPVLLNECNAAGVADEKISLVIALGTHRFMTREEIAVKYGAETVRRIRIKNHPYKDMDAMIDLGVTDSGGRILINKEVYEADFKIGIGSIVPHHIPGYAGGAKIVQPGVSGEDTTAYTHLLSVRAPRSFLGVLDNPVRKELDLMARKVGLNTIFNTVLNRHGQLVEAFFGDVVEAFQLGVKKASDVYEIEISEEADIVISSSHPCDLEFWQAHKTLYPSDLAVKAGGIIILVSPCYEGVAKTHCDILDITCHSLDEIRSMVSLKQIHDEVAAALAIAWSQVKERESVFIVSDGICAEDAKKLGFKHFASVQTALDAALAAKGAQARITVLTHAPDMLPVIRK